LLAEKAERQRTFGKLAARITAQRREIGAMQRDEKRLSQLIERLARIVSSDKPVSRGLAAALPEPGRFAALRGRLRLPVRGEVSNRFGAPRHDSGVPWKGVFLRAAEGSEVRAVADGRVVFADWMRGFGNLMIVDHDDGYLSIYGNNEALLKQIGERVGGGESLATVGSSGGNTQSGLYFEIRHKGRAIDPLTWVGKK
jgi:septal ring factor EnvC (AmiA/AmiB activator)